jgi:hypothetical protein
LRSFFTFFKNNTLLLWAKEISYIHKVKKGNKMKKIEMIMRIKNVLKNVKLSKAEMASRIYQIINEAK